MFTSFSRRALAASAVFLPVGVFAQVQPTLTVAFDSANVVVPVGGAATIAAGLLLALTAFWVLRKRGAAARAVLGLFAAAIVAAGGLMATESDAGTPTPVSLVTSPTTIAVSFGAYSFQNATNGPIIIRAVRLQDAPFSYLIDSQSTTCTPSLRLAPGASCLVNLIFTPI